MRRVLPQEGIEPFHGGFWLRWVANLMDGLLLQIGLFIVTHAARLAPASVILLEVAAALLYFPLWECSAAQSTPGKLAMGLVVTDIYGDRLGFWQALGRNLSKIVSNVTLLIGYVMAGWTARKQALHDLMANTCIVRRHSLQAWHDLQARLHKTDAPVYGRGGMPAWGIALLAIVLVGIVSIAVPLAYRIEKIRSQVMEGMALADTAKQAVAQQLKWTRVPPTDNAAVYIGAPQAFSGKYVTSVAIDNGTVVVTYGNQADGDWLHGKHLVLTPVLKDGGVTWRCSSADIESFGLPPSCAAP
jgi:uncharacterized RDD family membrane protein YckC